MNLYIKYDSSFKRTSAVTLFNDTMNFDVRLVFKRHLGNTRETTCISNPLITRFNNKILL